MIKPTEEDIKNLCEENYYSQWANDRFISFHSYMAFCDAPAIQGCEAKAVAERRGEWIEEPTQALLVGSYVDSYFEGSLEKFKKEHSEIFLKDGSLKAPYKQAEIMIKRCEADPLFMASMGGVKQQILTAYVPELNCYCRAKIDSYDKDRFITDLKTTQDIHKCIKTKIGYVDFCTAYNYEGQLAFYQRIAEINTGKKLPVFIAAVEKSNFPEIAVINIPQDVLDEAYEKIVDNMPRVLAVINGEVEPCMCGRCNYCKIHKKLDKPIALDTLIWDY